MNFKELLLQAKFGQNSHNRITDAISALATERINYRRNS